MREQGWAGKLRRGLGACAVAAVTAAGCSGTSHVDMGSFACAPGRSVECTAPGGCRGGQICNDEGTAFGPCVCEERTSEPEPDASRSPETADSAMQDALNPIRDAPATVRPERDVVRTDLAVEPEGAGAIDASLEAESLEADTHSICDDERRCYCLRILSLGLSGRAGAQASGYSSVAEWLDGNSNTRVDVLATHASPLTPALLARYDLVLLQSLENDPSRVDAAAPGPTVGDTAFWLFSQAEVDTLTRWVESGGGLVAFSGYESSATEVEPTNQLLGAFGISYQADDVLGHCEEPLCYCWDSLNHITDWRSGDPDSAALSAGVRAVGGLLGRSLWATDAITVAQYGDAKVAVAKRFGRGKVFAFSDEWITYVQPEMLSAPSKPDPTDSCYDPSLGLERSAGTEFQVERLWYNLIRWIMPPKGCSFELYDEDLSP